MIQRVQTLFLLAVAITMGLLFVFPIWEKSNLSKTRKVELDALYYYEYEAASASSAGWEEVSITPVFYIGIAAGLSAILAIIVIFLFKNRILQMKLSALNAFLIMASLGISAYFIYNGENEMGFESKGVFKPGFFLPVGALLLNSLANRFIKKDEKLVRSVDRIR